MERVRHVVRQARVAPDLLFDMAEADRVNLGRLWLLAQFQSYRSSVTFQEAVDSLKGYFRQRHSGKCWSPPRRDQVLGKMREAKVDEFVDFWGQMKDQYGIDIYQAAASLSSSDLIFGDGEGFFHPLAEIPVKVGRPVWEQILRADQNKTSDLSEIPLPKRIAHFYESKLVALQPA